MNYAIGIGGTGIRCIEALIHLYAAGLGNDSPLFVLAIDPDASNGNVKRLSGLLKSYNQLQEGLRLKSCPFFSKAVHSGRLNGQPGGQDLSVVWSPIQNTPAGDTPCLRDLLGYANLSADSKKLCNLLYTDAEREMKLQQGFRGRTSVGAAAMATVSMNATVPPWSNMLQAVQADVGAGESPRVFVFASAFGGTGASGFPVIGDFLKEKLTEVGAAHGLGGALVLPYFGFMPTQQNGEVADPYARSEHFVLNTRLALQHYAIKWDKTSPYGAIYLMGDVSQAQRPFVTGGPQQENPASHIELLAAHAALDFYEERWNEPAPKRYYYAGPDQAAYVPAESGENEVAWSGLPSAKGSRVKERLLRLAALGTAYLDFYYPLLTDARFKQQPGLAPWYVEHFSKRQDNLFVETEEKKLKQLRDYFQLEFFPWLVQVHEKAPGQNNKSVRLFQADLLRSREQKPPRDFTVLAWEKAVHTNGGAPDPDIYDRLWNNLCDATRFEGTGASKFLTLLEASVAPLTASAFRLQLEKETH